MTKQEKELFFKLCNFTEEDKHLSGNLIKRYATPTVLGHLAFNRMAAVAYGTMKNEEVLSLVNREFRNSLQVAYEQNIQKNESYFKCVKYLTDVLKPCEGKYAMLKGALLCRLYPKGYRTSNDIDLLVCDSDVTLVGNALSKHGFKQGNVRNGEFKAATRQEIVESRMLRGETVPYIKEVDLPYMKYLEVDINFSLDYKNGDPDILKDMLSKAQCYKPDGLSVVTLNQQDFFIHLCGHLYKEATTLPWIIMKRDMTLYKYLDINLLLSRFSEKDVKGILERAAKLGMSEVCACVICWTEDLLPCSNKSALKYARDILSGREELLLTVVSPSEHKMYRFEEKDTVKRFFCGDRSKRIRSVEHEEA